MNVYLYVNMHVYKKRYFLILMRMSIFHFLLIFVTFHYTIIIKNENRASMLALIISNQEQWLMQRQFLKTKYIFHIFFQFSWNLVTFWFEFHAPCVFLYSITNFAYWNTKTLEFHNCVSCFCFSVMKSNIIIFLAIFSYINLYTNSSRDSYFFVVLRICRKTLWTSHNMHVFCPELMVVDSLDFTYQLIL